MIELKTHPSDSSKRRPHNLWPGHRFHAFTLIEILVVISIISVLVGILLPVLAKARKAAQVAACLSAQRQLAMGVATYANDHDGQIPRGPLNQQSFIAMAFGGVATEDQVASSIILNSGTVGVYFNAHGLVLKGYLDTPASMFCPGDDTFDPIEELKKVQDLQPPAFSSFVYRNLDQAPLGRLSDLGRNDLGEQATVLGLDSNSVFESSFSGPFSTYRTNHEAQVANAFYTDGHAKTFDNQNNEFSLVAADYSGWSAIEEAYNRFLQKADAVP